jgi:hypothetical protein
MWPFHLFSFRLLRHATGVRDGGKGWTRRGAERELRIVDSPGVTFDDDDEGIQDQRESSVFL